MKTKSIIVVISIITIFLLFIFISGCKKDPVLPTVTTGEMSQITENSASGSGNATADGGAEITLKGLCWATTPDPTILNGFINATSTGIGSFNCNLIALAPNTQYYVRAFATNEVGTAYGNTVTFTTLEGETPEDAPVVSTVEVSEILANTAVSGGVVTSDAGSTVTARGVCWSEGTTPTISDSKTVNGTGAGSFTSNITGLNDGTTYYVRAYATNANGTGYGSAMSFTTLTIENATVVTVAATGITTTTAISGGNVTDDGNGSITARGVCWSTAQNPTISDSFTTNGTGTGSFTSNITGLSDATTYYVRAYATNANGTAYGNQISFTTIAACNGFTDSRDGNFYNAVQIGDQCWMAENLKYLPSVAGPDASPQFVNYYVYEYDGTNVAAAKLTANYDTYGVLYSYDAARNGQYSSNLNPSGVQGVCPSGWHLPSDSEWQELEMSLGMSQAQANANGERGTNEGSKLAGDYNLWSDGALRNDSDFGTTGFSALPGGLVKESSSSFEFKNLQGFWWTISLSGESNIYRSLQSSSSKIIRTSYLSKYAMSVRCVRD
jgi:uncharacterized protein (TIGR02145 family)